MALVGLLAASWYLGALAMRGAQFVQPLHAAVRLGAGLYFAAILGLLLGLQDLAWPAYAWYLIAAAGIVREVWGKSSATAEPTPRNESWIDPRCKFMICCATLSCVGLLLALLNAFTPLVAWGPNAGYAATVAEHARAGTLTYLADGPLAASPPLPTALYSAVFYASGEKPAQLLTWALLFVPCACAWHIGRRHSLASAWAAVAGIATMPLLFAEAAEFSPLIISLVFFVPALALIVDTNLRANAPSLFLAAMLAGAAAISHGPGVLPAFLLIALVLWRERRLHAVLLLIAIGGLAAFPWWLFDVMQSGSDWERPGSAGSIIHAFAFPFGAALRPFDHEGWRASVGPLPLALGIPAMFAAPASAALGLFGVLGLFLGGFFTPAARWMLFFFAALAVNAGAVAEMPRFRIAYRLCFLLLAGGTLALNALLLWPRLAAFSETREEYLARQVPMYEAITYCNEFHPGETVLLFRPLGYYLESPARYLAADLQRLQEEPLEAQLEWLRAQEVDLVVLPGLVVERNPWLASWRSDAGGLEVLKSIDYVEHGALVPAWVLRVKEKGEAT